MLSMHSSTLICTQHPCLLSLAICLLWRKATNWTVGSSTTEKPPYLLLRRAAPLGEDHNTELADRMLHLTTATATDAMVSMVADILSHRKGLGRVLARGYQLGLEVLTGSHHDRPLQSIITAAGIGTGIGIGHLATEAEEVVAETSTRMFVVVGTTSTHTFPATRRNVWTDTTKSIGVEIEGTRAEHGVARRLDREWLTGGSGTIDLSVDRVAVVVIPIPLGDSIRIRGTIARSVISTRVGDIPDTAPTRLARTNTVEGIFQNQSSVARDDYHLGARRRLRSSTMTCLMRSRLAADRVRSHMWNLGGDR